MTSASTEIYAYFQEINKPDSDISILLSKAEEYDDLDTNFANILCKAATVMIVSDLESFIKEMVKVIIIDINENTHFKDMPNAIKRTYSRQYLTADQKGNVNEKKLSNLINKFSELDCKISHEAFFNKANENPNVLMIKNVFDAMGFCNILYGIRDSKFDDVFQSEYKDISAYDWYPSLEEKIQGMPSPDLLSTFNIKKSNKPAGSKPLYEDYLENILKKRHDIVHGNNLEEILGVFDLKKIANKAKFLKNALLLVGFSCAYNNE